MEVNNILDEFTIVISIHISYYLESISLLKKKIKYM